MPRHARLTALAALGALAQQASSYVADNGAVIIPGASSYNGLSLTPTMGWDNWNAYGCDVSEDLLLTTAASMVKYGLRDSGYDTIVLDDCWSVGRNASGYLVSNPTRFPRGMRYISDQLHSMGMKFGMYSSAGVFTCAKYPGSLGNEEKDAAYFAEMGVDYLKYDNCYNQGQSGTAQISFNRYSVMSKALNATGRSIVYGLCSWGDDNPWDWAQTMSNSGRMSGDIYDSFNRPDARCPCTENPCNWPGFHCSVMNILGKMAPIVSRTQTGYFNDMDLLEVGNGGQDDNEYVTHFSMWSMMSSPLLMGTNILNLSPQNLAILSNPAVIALNQDPSGSAGNLIYRNNCSAVDEYGQCDVSLWVRSLSNGDMAIALLNNANTSMMINASLAQVFLDDSTAGASMPAPQLSQTWDVYDLWANRMSTAEANTVKAGTNSSMVMVGNVTTAGIVPVAMNSTTRYNVTRTSYAAGLAANNTALFGSKVGTIPPHGTWSAEIARHSVGLYRLRMQGGNVAKRDEL